VLGMGVQVGIPTVAVEVCYSYGVGLPVLKFIIVKKNYLNIPR
jgi:hypothetical protein